jgi:serine/threonine-protein kinase PknK
MTDDFTTFGIPGLVELAEIGLGTAGVVYRARQVDFGWDVALKILTQMTTHPAVFDKFQRERHRMGMLSGHPHIVMVYDWGFTATDHPYLVMEYLAAGSLADRLQRTGPLDWEEAVTVGVKLAGALEDAHQQKVLHCDVKPENVLVSDTEEPKLSDFGIARPRGLVLRKASTALATFAYAAPEVLEGGSPTATSDVYSLTATVFTLIAGQPPFSDANDGSFLPTLLRIKNEDMPDLRPRGVPDAVCKVLQHGMARDPADRLQTAADLGDALRSVEPGHAAD